MSNGNWTPTEESALAQHLVTRVCDAASGRSEPECFRNYPRDVYFIGNLRPRQNEADADPDQPAHLRELLNKLAPMAFGAEFLLNATNDEETVQVGVGWACYYRVFPTLAQQHQQQIPVTQAGSQEAPPSEAQDDDTKTEPENETAPDADEDGPQPPTPPRRRRTPGDSLFLRFKK